MVDLHCHILPGIDDGAKNEKDFFDMINIAIKDGISLIITTPHHSRHFTNKISDVRDMVKRYNEILSEKNLNIKLVAGQEVHIRSNLIEMLDNGDIQPIENTNYMLIEFPFDKLPSYAIDIIYELRVRGIIPIIAHPERYTYVMNDETLLNDFIREGCLFQINAISLRGDFGKKVKATADKLVKNNIVDFIASDSHNTGKKAPIISDVIKSLDKDKKLKIKRNMENFFDPNYNIPKHKEIEKEGFFSRMKSIFK